MNQQELDPAQQEEQTRNQIRELLRLVAREVVRRIAADGNGSSGESCTPGFKKVATQRGTGR